jgi:hypothetical protein
MRAQGAMVDDRRDRGNYAAGSKVINSVYDYASGLGPPGVQQPGGRTLPG